MSVSLEGMHAAIAQQSFEPTGIQCKTHQVASGAAADSSFPYVKFRTSIQQNY
jgi:hypothetical protein